MADNADNDACSSNNYDDESLYDEGFGSESRGDALSNNNTNIELSVAEKIVRRELRFLRCIRFGLFVVLLAASGLASGLVYKALASRERTTFKEAFLDHSSKLTAEFQTSADRCLGTVAAFSTTITSYAKSTNATWPFVMIPEFEAQVRHVIELANIEALVFAPLVAGNERKEWEEKFVPQNIYKWFNETIASKELYDGYIVEETLTLKYSPTIIAATFSPDEDGDGMDEFAFATSTDQIGPYLPVLQYAPFHPGIHDGTINIDAAKEVTLDGNVVRLLSEHNALIGRYSSQGHGEYGDGNPQSAFLYPILKDLSLNSTLAGALATLIKWIPFFSNILPESAVGIVGILSNSCNQSFSFRIDGATATYLGDGDHHDVRYDYLKQEVSFLSLLSDSFDNKKYLGVPLDDTGCTYSLSIFPSHDLYHTHMTSTPMIASIVILLVFLGTSSIFLLYDRLVERRQRSVQKIAESSGAIVSSLFPAAYRERLMATHESDGNAKKINTMESTDDQPIADLYEECTVLFADIAGFTQWSSSREPVHVFYLLQEIFAMMDKIAKKFRVFKVETIGDCYMAVTGLPNPQSNHAQLMSRFASDCLVQMRETTTRLMSKLGDDTANLTLRIGLHSGPVTAGILLGEKSRFQLFGDTVNTASRMESTGEKSCIQVSSTTADKLRQVGKGHWLQQREDLVVAKGKGQLQTYWLVTDRGTSESRDSTVRDDVDDVQKVFEI